MLLDRVGELADVVAGDAAEHRPADQHQPDGDRQAGHGELAVDPRPPAAGQIGAVPRSSGGGFTRIIMPVICCGGRA